MPPMLQPINSQLYLRLMDVPDSFRVHMPQSFLGLLKPWKTLSAIEVPGRWVEMSGGPLPVRIAVRIDKADDGRFVITGLLVGLRERKELTWEALRAIKPATLLSYLFEGFDPSDPTKQYDETTLLKSREVGPDFDARAWLESDEDDPDDEMIEIGGPKWNRSGRAQAAFEIWKETAGGQPDGDEKPVETIMKPRTRLAADLTDFAQVYSRHASTTPHRATQATADELFISRATVIRRIAECRKLGLLPPKSDGGGKSGGDTK